jgi:cysteine-rich repeat protein
MFRCIPGYHGPDGGVDCVACAPGKYKSSRGPMACTKCQSLHATSPLASTKSTDCSCNKGYEGQVRTDQVVVCDACPPDTYKNGTGNFGCNKTQITYRPCGLYCWVLPYRADWANASYFVDLNVGDEVFCNSTCGDAMRAGLEECDDGNTNDGDGCSSSCRFEDVANATSDGSWYRRV